MSSVRNKLQVIEKVFFYANKEERIRKNYNLIEIKVKKKRIAQFDSDIPCEAFLKGLRYAIRSTLKILHKIQKEKSLSE